MITCGFCRVVYDQWQEHCTSCGGRLPPRDGGLGPPPEPAPRRLPKGYATRQWFSRNPTMIIGLAFFPAGTAMFTLFALQKTWFALFPGFFMLAGFSALCRGIAYARRTVGAYRRGAHVEGRVVSIEKDPLYKGSGQQAPWIFKYCFTVDGVQYENSFSTFDSVVRSRPDHGPIWVLYLPHRPRANTIYPPLV